MSQDDDDDPSSAVAPEIAVAGNPEVFEPPHSWTLAVNTAMLTALRLVSSLAALALNWTIARRGAGDLGSFRTVFVFFTIAESLLLFGMQSYLFREISLHRKQVLKYAGHGLVLASVASLFAAGALIALAHGGAYSRNISTGLWIILFSLPASAANLCALCVFVGLEKSRWYALIQTVETIVRTGVGIALLYLGWGIMSVIAVFVACRWMIQLVNLWVLAPYVRGDCWTWDGAFFRKFLSHVPTFAGITIMALVIGAGAQVMLPWIRDDRTAGEFSAAAVFVDLVLMVPSAFVTNLVPRFALYARESIDRLSASCRFAMTITAAGIVPIVIGTMVMAGPLIDLVYRHNPAYLPSVPILQISIWICLLRGIDQVLSSALVASGRQNLDFLTLSIGSSVMVTVSYVLIHRDGAIGAAVGLVSGTGALLVTRFFLVCRHLPGLNPFVLFWRLAVGAAVMLLVMHAAGSLTWWLNGICGATSYVLTILALGFARGLVEVRHHHL
jgi:O-antigen/teichoic acid export membrane protein